MGVYVKDATAPKNCTGCIAVHYYMSMVGDAGMLCEVTGLSMDDYYSDGRPDWCPLIEVPEPHGRLIDADALVEDMKRQCEEVFKIDAVSPDDFWITRDQAYNERLWKTWCESFFEYLKTRETIIPESEEG